MKPFIIISVLSLLVITSACRTDPAPSTSPAPAAAPEKTPAETSIPATDNLTYIPGKHFGKLTGSTLEGDLKFLYGKRIIPKEMPIGEGMTTPGYSLFPGTKNEVGVVFPDGENGFEQLTIIISNQDADWRMPGNALAIGTSLHDLKALNEKPITFLGYEWDYGGLIVDWNGGKLEGLGGTLSNPEPADGKALPNKLVGDGEVSSDNPLLKGMGIMVAEITVGLAPPVFSEDGIPERTDFAIVPGYRFGAVTADVRPDDLPLIYGVGNVEPMEYELPGGVSVPGYRLFSGTKNEVEIGFPDKDEYLEGVEFRITREGSDWHLAGTDIRVGDHLDEVRAVNRKPLLIYDHNMEGAGAVQSWEGGRLAGTGLFFDTTEDGRAFKYNDEHNVSSETEEVKTSNPKVAMMEINLKR